MAHGGFWFGLPLTEGAAPNQQDIILQQFAFLDK
jgi:hypothetical protein